MNGFGASRLAVIVAMLVIIVGPLGLGGVLHGLHHHHDPTPTGTALDCGPGCADPDHHHEQARKIARCPLCTSAPAPVVTAIHAMKAFDAVDLGEVETWRPPVRLSFPPSIWPIRAPPALSRV